MSRTLLVADDSTTIRQVVQLAFADEVDIDVVAVSSGREAIQQIEAHRPALVLADTRMPDQTGYDVAEFVRRRAGCERLPVVLLTGAFEPVDETRARDAGCQAVLVKPFEPSKLVTTVRDLLGPIDELSTVEPDDGAVSETAHRSAGVEEVRVAPVPSGVEITEELVDRVATRVIERLSDRTIEETTREVVGRTAERLVGEEIARLKEKLR